MPRYLLAAFASLALGLPEIAHAEDPFATALFLSKSVFYQHDVITEHDGEDSLVERVLREILADHNIMLDATKDASRINAEELAGYDVVIFYTQGDLTKEGLDEKPPMAEDGLQTLLTWIQEGGGFVGIHSATDTFRPMRPDDPITPFTAMLGGAFRAHGRQFEGTVRVADPDHPAVDGVPGTFELKDEWYLFSHVDHDDMHVLALLDPGNERTEQKLYDVAPYPVVWCKDYGDGRVYYNAMGHRRDVWDNAHFRRLIANGVQWALGQTELKAAPNYSKAVKESTD